LKNLFSGASRKKGEHDAQDYRQAGTQYDILESLLPCERTDCQSDHHGVVTGQNDINDD
jgi:hypothetical protein